MQLKYLLTFSILFPSRHSSIGVGLKKETTHTQHQRWHNFCQLMTATNGNPKSRRDFWKENEDSMDSEDSSSFEFLTLRYLSIMISLLESVQRMMTRRRNLKMWLKSSNDVVHKLTQSRGAPTKKRAVVARKRKKYSNKTIKINKNPKIV